MTIPSGCWRGIRGAACVDDAKASTKATANNLIIVTLLLKSPKAGLLPFASAHIWAGGLPKQHKPSAFVWSKLLTTFKLADCEIQLRPLNVRWGSKPAVSVKMSHFRFAPESRPLTE